MQKLDTAVDPVYPRSHHSILNQPKMIGYFSVNDNREFVADASYLRYLKMSKTRKVELDLNVGLEEFRPKPESVKKEKMDFLLRFIVNNIDRFKVKNNSQRKLLNPDIICSRGRLVQIMCDKQYTTAKNWSLIVSKYKGNIYICQPDGDDFPTKQTAYAFKFEQYLLSENPLVDPVTNIPVVESEEFYGVFESGLDHFSLLYNAEIDGLDSSSLVDLTEADFGKLKFVELKTCLNLVPGDSRYCKWWAHTFLAGISDCIVGHRTPNGIVTEIENLSIDFLGSQTQANWSPTKCIARLKEVLSAVRFVCNNTDSPHTVYKFDYDRKRSRTIQCTKFEGKNDYSFLPDWYIDEISS